MEKIKLYGRYERYWHWTQVVLIALLILTGFEIHSSYQMFGYEEAVLMHNVFGWGYSVLLIFTFFWMLVTKFYQQLIPDKNKFVEQFHFYRIGIMRNEPHPMRKTPEKKLNPIQSITYLGLMWITIPLQVITGFMYMYFNIARAIGIESLQFVAQLHTLIAYMVIAFLIIHVYMITTGKTVTTYLKGMVTGEEEVEPA